MWDIFYTPMVETMGYLMQVYYFITYLNAGYFFIHPWLKPWAIKITFPFSFSNSHQLHLRIPRCINNVRHD